MYVNSLVQLHIEAYKGGCSMFKKNTSNIEQITKTIGNDDEYDHVKQRYVVDKSVSRTIFSMIEKTLQSIKKETPKKYAKKKRA